MEVTFKSDLKIYTQLSPMFQQDLQFLVTVLERFIIMAILEAVFCGIDGKYCFLTERCF